MNQLKGIKKGIEARTGMKAEKYIAMQLAAGAVGLYIRKVMYDKGMIKKFWLPCMIRKPGTYKRGEV